MYCGDEVSAIVADVGTHSSKFGFAGEDAPRRVIHSGVGQRLSGSEAKKKFYVGAPQLRHSVSNIHVESPIANGKISDWDRVEALWSHALNELAPHSAVEHPLLVSVSATDSASARAKYAELLFERFDAPCIFFGPQPMLSAFSVGRANALVCNFGAGPIDVSPVYGGCVLRENVQVSSSGGNFIDACLMKQIERASSGMDALVKFPVNVSTEMPGNILPSYRKWLKMATVQDVKHSTCRVWTETSFNAETAGLYIPAKYELPDGSVINMGSERFWATERWMKPNRTIKGASVAFSNPGSLEKAPSTLIYDALKSTHCDYRKELAQNILLVGGGSLFPGITERLHKELDALTPPSFKTRFLTPSKVERMWSAWIGGSVLASLGSFQQLWVTKHEFAEKGARILEERCHH